MGGLMADVDPSDLPTLVGLVAMLAAKMSDDKGRWLLRWIGLDTARRAEESGDGGDAAG
jgi:hypothetical protein